MPEMDFHSFVVDTLRSLGDLGSHYLSFAVTQIRIWMKTPNVALA